MGETWKPIIDAVKEPIALAALVVLCLAMVGRLALGKVAVLRGGAGYKVTIYTISSVAFLALLTGLGAIAFKFYELHMQSETKTVALTRLDAENILQKHRGDLERCTRELKLCPFLDFVFSGHAEAGLNVDVFVGSDTSIGDVEFMHPRSRLPRMFSEFPGTHKLSATFPDSNRCVIDSVTSDLKAYFLADGAGFAHRYVTDWGAGQAAAFRKYVPDEPLITHEYSQSAKEVGGKSREK